MKPPLFIVGCPRSGTTLLYHMLLSSGGFAAFRKETHLYEMVVPRFGDLRTARARQKFETEWLNSHFGNVPGYDVKPIIRRAVGECRSGGHFLRLLMEGIAQVQQVDRWLEATPAHVTHIERIKQDFPDARVVHVIRDGRDAALSIDKQHWIAPFPWDRRLTLAVAALYWEWMVKRGRASGRRIGRDYLEVRFEDLIGRPRETLEEVAAFLDYQLDYERMQSTALGTLRTPNTSFKENLTQGEFNPVGRWQVECPPDDIRICEQLVGTFLEELGYPLAGTRQRSGPRALAMRALYVPYFTAKRWLKTHTPLGRAVVDTSLWAADVSTRGPEGSGLAS
jgi:hypothetical protein